MQSLTILLIANMYRYIGNGCCYYHIELILYVMIRNLGVTIDDGEARHDFVVTLYFQSTFARFTAQKILNLRNFVDSSSKLGQK